jgi:hypothetical protein
VHEDAVDPVGGNLLDFPRRGLLEEFVDFSVDLVKGVEEDGETV